MPLVSGLAEDDLAPAAEQSPTFGFGGLSELCPTAFIHSFFFAMIQLHLFFGRFLLGHAKAMGASHVITLARLQALLLSIIFIPVFIPLRAEQSTDGQCCFQCDSNTRTIKRETIRAM